MKVTICHKNNTKTEHLVERDELDRFVETHLLPGQYFTVGNMYPDGWYEREYRKAETIAC